MIPLATAYQSRPELPVMQELSANIEKLTGLYFPESRWHILLHKLELIMSSFGFTDSYDLVNWLQSGKLKQKHVEIIAGILSVGETYFFRDPALYHAIRKIVVPDFLRSSASSFRKMNIWCAGCSTGEEPYSISITLQREFEHILESGYSILATDINRAAIAKAQIGRFREWSFREAPVWLIPDFFTEEEPHLYRIHPVTRKHIHFRFHNLVSDAMPEINGSGKYDLILCRNVLIYFHEKTISDVIDRLVTLLDEGGYLITGNAEAPLIRHPGLVLEDFTGLAMFRKCKQGRQEAASIIRNNNLPQKQAGKHEEKSNAASGKATRKPAPSQTSAAIQKKPSVEQDKQQVIQWFREESFTELTAYLSKNSALSEDRDCELIYLQSLMNTGNCDQAEAIIKHKLNTDPLDADLHYFLGLIRLAGGNTEEASRSFSKSIYLNPEHAHANFHLGTLCVRKENHKKAKRYLTNALNLTAEAKSGSQPPYLELLSHSWINTLLNSINVN